MIAAILGVLFAALIFAAVALFVLWIVRGAERDAADLAAEIASRTTSGPARVYLALDTTDDLAAVSSAVTDHTGRAL